MEEIRKCLICANDKFKKYIDCKDYFLSKENFTILECENCGFRFTNPRPSTNNLSKYYKSDNYISHSNSKKGLINLAYQIARHYTLKKKFNLINKYISGNKILDVGCGTGEFLNYFKKHNWSTFGIEPNENARKFAIEKYNLKVKDENSFSDFKNDSFDVITMWHSLEHIYFLKETIFEIKRLLKNNGTLFIALPNCNCFDAKIYKEYWAGYDVPRHLYHFTPTSVKLLFKKYNFIIENIIPLKFDAYYISLLSEKYKNGYTNYIKAFINGIRSNNYARKNNNDYSSLIYIIKNE